MFIVAYFLAKMVHGPWDEWMGVFALLAIADGIVSLIELGARAVQSLLFWISLNQ